MELPPYRMPSFRILVLQMWHKASLYLRKAGTIILAASILIWIASNYPISTQIAEKYERLKNIEIQSDKQGDQKEEIITKLELQESGEQLEH